VGYLALIHLFLHKTGPIIHLAVRVHQTQNVMVYVIFVFICQFKQNKYHLKKMSNEYKVYHHERDE